MRCSSISGNRALRKEKKVNTTHRFAKDERVKKGIALFSGRFRAHNEIHHRKRRHWIDLVSSNITEKNLISKTALHYTFFCLFVRLHFNPPEYFCVELTLNEKCKMRKPRMAQDC
jgi:hypothetical protein